MATEFSPKTRVNASGGQRARPRVVVAEDDAEMRRLLGSAFYRDGCEVFEVKHGIDLLDLLATEILHPETPPAFDLIVSDVRMPGVTGLEILSGLRASGSQTLFILITAFGSPEVHAQALEQGAAFVFDKPFDINDLRAAAAWAIGLRTNGRVERDRETPS